MNVPSTETRRAPGKAQDLRRARNRGFLRRILVVVGLPTLISAAYLGLVASEEYESVCMFTVQSAEGKAAAGIDGLLGVLPGAGQARGDMLILERYIGSRAMLEKIDRENAFLAHYQNPAHDLWSRLKEAPNSEDSYRYFEDRVQATHDAESGILTLRVRAYEPDASRTFAQAILDASEQMVNGMAARARNDRISFAEREVQLSQKRLVQARQDLLALQRENAELNPVQSASTVLAVVGKLETELASAKADLSAARAMMRPDAPKVVSLRQRVQSLNVQLTRQKKRLAGAGDEGLSGSMARFEPAMMEKEFAQQAYQSALSALELARVDASRQHRYLVTVAPPSIADDATHPRRALGVLSVFLLSSLLFGIGSMLIASVREHARL